MAKSKLDFADDVGDVGSGSNVVASASIPPAAGNALSTGGALAAPVVSSPIQLVAPDLSPLVPLPSNPLAAVPTTKPQTQDYGIRTANPQIGGAVSNAASLQEKINYAVDYYQRELGLTPEQARGAVRWMANVESGLRPDAFNPAGGGQGALGIAQWRGDRQRALLAKYGPSPTFEQQLEFAKSELLGPERAALARLQQAQTEQQAYQTWGQAYERPGPVAFQTGLHKPRAGPLGSTPDFSSILNSMAPTNNDLAPKQVAQQIMQSPTTPQGPNLLALAALMAAGTHKITPVNYDPFAGVPKQEPTPTIQPAAPMPQVAEGDTPTYTTYVGLPQAVRQFSQRMGA